MLSARDRSRILDEIQAKLVHQPTVSTRNRKALRESALADWELRVGQYRVLYKVDESTGEVVIVAVGRKDRNRLFIEGKEQTL